MKVALVHYWLVGMRGGEKVLEALCELFPQADILTHVVLPEAISSTLRSHEIRTSFVARMPRARSWYKKYLPLMPLALEQLDVRDYDLIISSEAGPAKGIIPDPDATHLCYCHSPMRYIWNMYHDYRGTADGLSRMSMPLLAHYLRAWDESSAARVDCFVANSQNVAARIRKYYRRDAQVVHPPVNVDAFAPVREAELGDYHLMVGELVRYKRPDLAVRAFNASKRKLVVIGGGEMLKEIRQLAGPSVTVLGPQPFEQLRHHYARCRALIFPGEEDFGIVPVEAMASGRPVIAFGRGGATETVREGVSGILFHEQSVDALIAAVEQLEDSEFDSAAIAAHARAFDRVHFKKRMRAIIEATMDDTRGAAPAPWDGPAPRTLAPRAPRSLRSDPDANHGEVQEGGYGDRRAATASAGARLRRVAVFNVKYSPNLGDGVIAECLEHELRSRLAGVDVVSLDLAGRHAYEEPVNARKRAAQFAFLDRLPRWCSDMVVAGVLGHGLKTRLRPAWRDGLKDADLAIFGGGQLIQDCDLNFPLKLAAAADECRHQGIPITVYAVGVAPSRSARGRRLLSRLLGMPPRPVFLAARDPESALNLATFGWGTADSICRDPGLLASRLWPAPPHPPRTRPLVGLCITHPGVVQHHADEPRARDAAPHLLDLYAIAVQDLVAGGYDVLCFSDGAGEDELAITAARGRLLAADPADGGRVRIAPRARTPGDLARLIAGLDAVVAHRLHAAILAYSYGIPAVGLRWDSKLPAFFASVGRLAHTVLLDEAAARRMAALVAEARADPIDRAAREGVLGEASDGVGRLLAAVAAAPEAAAPPRPGAVHPQPWQRRAAASPAPSRRVDSRGEEWGAT